MNEIDIINDMAKLTSLPKRAILSVIEKGVYCICEAVQETSVIKEDITCLDIGFGKLYIKNNNNESLMYKFVPSEFLELELKEALQNKKTILKDELEESLFEKLSAVYKELL